MSTRIGSIEVSLTRRITGPESIGIHIHDDDRDRTFNYTLTHNQASQLMADLEVALDESAPVSEAPYSE